MTDNWPLDRSRVVFASEFFTVKELTEKQQQNHWLRNRDTEDGVYTQYPTYDYSYGAYECMTVDELKAAFLYGNWSIRQCFTYKNLAFINQINAGDEWWTLKKFEDGRLLDFDSITMIRTINHEMNKWTEDFNTSEYEDYEDGKRFRVIRPWVAKEHAAALTKKYHEGTPDYHYKEARFVVGQPKDKKNDFGIYFVDVATKFFPEYIEQLLKATYEQCGNFSYLDAEFMAKWTTGVTLSMRVHSARELSERLE